MKLNTISIPQQSARIVRSFNAPKVLTLTRSGVGYPTLLLYLAKSAIMNLVQHADLDCPMIACVHDGHRRQLPGSMRKLTGVVVLDSQISKTCRVPSRRHPTLKVILPKLRRVRM